MKFQDQFSQFVHNHFGFNQYRQAIKIRKDAFYQLIPNQDSASDNQLLKRLSKTVQNIGQLCYEQCIQKSYALYTVEEKQCVRKCTKEYFRGYHAIVQWTNKRNQQI